ncbi:MAG: hypothetical protein BGO98_02085 [Myxococcales bacterium 68-20]|nr:hypothetical protein [Myxococcales bacterium]OJY21639.1 MAG: hypothetical protein BGO98_02085 [Myxococcales bacterium 68-20]
MSSPTDEIAADERTELLERRARIIRSRLLRVVDTLDARRHHIAEVVVHAKLRAKSAALSLIGIGAHFGASLFAVSLALKARRRRSLSYRVSEALRRLDLGKRLNLVARPSFGRRVFDTITISVITFAASEVAKRVTKNLVDGRPAQGSPRGRRGARGRFTAGSRTPLRAEP